MSGCVFEHINTWVFVVIIVCTGTLARQNSSRWCYQPWLRQGEFVLLLYSQGHESSYFPPLEEPLSQ